MPTILERNPTLLDRMGSKFLAGDDHWPWTGANNGAGYGQIWADEKLQYAHRVMWEIFNGPIPEGLVVDHLCHTPACIRPAHLQLVTHAGNMKRQARSLSLTCTHGHPWNRENTYIDSDGHRNCRVCRRAGLHRWYDAKGRALRKKKWREEGK